MRYIILLGARPTLPTKQLFAGWRKGLLQLGIRHGMRPVEVPWRDLGHCLIAGMTQWGKSTALRLFVVQAAPEGFEIYLGDYYGNTFGLLAGIFHPQIKSLARTGAEYLVLAQKVKVELEARIELYRQCAGAPDGLEGYNKNAAKPLRPVLVLIDEHTAATKELGGRDGEYNLLIERILRTGLKYGIQVVLASQDFFVEDVDRVRSHCATKLCLRVESASLSRTILQTGGAERLKYKGRALSNRWGELQLFLVTKDQLVAAFRSQDTGMTPDENRLARFLYSYPEKAGWVDIDRIRAYFGCSYGFAKDIRSSWVDRGLAKHHPELNNAIQLVNQFEPLPDGEVSLILSKISLPARAEGVD
jgi:DNA segregation ATPase FtsK/SpoIIIE-like protein